MYIWCGKAFFNCALLFTTIVSLRANANRREKSEISSSPQHTSTWLTSWLRGCPWSQQQWRDLFQILYLWVVSVYFFFKNNAQDILSERWLIISSGFGQFGCPCSHNFFFLSSRFVFNLTIICLLVKVYDVTKNISDCQDSSYWSSVCHWLFF